MRDDVLVRKVLMDCPACGHRHFVEERKRRVRWRILDEVVYSHERYFHCAFADEEMNDWQTIEMEEESSENGHDAYRTKLRLFSSKDIYNIRLLYRLSQRELEILLDLEPHTIERYERDTVQSVYVDRLLREIQHPLQLMMVLSNHRDQFSTSRRREILDRISEVIFVEEEIVKTCHIHANGKRRNINPNPALVDLNAIWELQS